MTPSPTPVALVTGCSSGIGRALTPALVQAGYTVFAGARKPETLADLAEAQVLPLRLDVNNADDIRAAIAQVERDAGRLDLLVNNAGYGAMGPLAEMPLAEVQAQFATNLFAPLALIQAAFPLMRRQGRGVIVNIGSVSGILPTPFSGAYCASKAALHTLSDVLRMELAPFGIDVITVQPGAIASEFGNTATQRLADTLQGDHSAYGAIADDIRKRAGASQDHPTSAEDFAAQLVQELAQRGQAVVRIGNGSTLMPLIRHLLPQALQDRILGRKFGLHRLGAG